MANYDVESHTNIHCTEEFFFFFWHPMLVRPVMKRLFFPWKTKEKRLASLARLMIRKSKNQECWPSRSCLFGKGTFYANFSIPARLFLSFFLALTNSCAHFTWCTVYTDCEGERKRFYVTSRPQVIVCSSWRYLRFQSVILRWITLYVPDGLQRCYTYWRWGAVHMARQN